MAPPLCRFGYNCWRPDCWLQHPEGRASDAGGKDKPPRRLEAWSPRQKHAHLVVLWENQAMKTSGAGALERLHVLLQLRSPGTPASCHLTPVGCQRNCRDTDSRSTALRVASESPGLVDLGHLEGAPAQSRRRARAMRASRPTDIVKFGEGVEHDWWTVHLLSPGTFEPTRDYTDSVDVGAVLKWLPCALPAPCYGHIWIPLDRLGEGCVPLMVGLLRRVFEAVAALDLPT